MWQAKHHAFRLIPGLWLAALMAAHAAEVSVSPEGRDFFENKIRPVLVTECNECHNATKHKGGLRLDYRDGWKKGGDSGDAIVPGDAAHSLLIKSIRHEDPDLKMPAKSPKLDDKVIADFEKWVNMGAPDPRDQPPAEPAGKPSWPDLLAARRNWWSLQPVQKPALPTVQNAAWSAHPVDRFLLAKMEEHQLAPARDADPATLLRRLTFTLTGLPPTVSDVEEFVASFPHDPQAAVAQATDRLLASPHFGEHWARHWLDLVRYAETHGSESDPEIREAWRYRDYVIRALNNDVPLDQFIRENIAGDLLAHPRANADGINESILGTAQLRFVEHGFQPVDSLDDQVRAVDNQIDVVSKAFQGLTISCARCHDHKFDAISQRDYYALYGVFASCRPAQVTIDTAEVQTKNREALEQQHAKIKSALAGAWLKSAEQVATLLQDATKNHDVDQVAANPAAEALSKMLADAAANPANPFHFWAKLGATNNADFPAAWQKIAEPLRADFTKAHRENQENFPPAWNLTGGDYAKWFPYGPGLTAQPVPAGEFAVKTDGNRILDGLYPGGALTNRLSEKQTGILTSPRFKIETSDIMVRASGAGGAMVRVIVDNYPLPTNGIFPKAVLDKDEPGWVRLDTAYRKGSYAYLEFATHEDLTRPVEDKKEKAKIEPEERPPSHFGVEQVIFHEGPQLPVPETSALAPLLDGAAPNSAAELAKKYSAVIAQAVAAWRDHQLTESQRLLLDDLVRHGVLPATLSELETLRPLVAEYRRLEAAVPQLHHAPGVLETAGFDAPLFLRGDYLKPGESVPRAYLGVFGGQPFQTSLSGRRELAEAIANAQNPLTARVMANRIWHWVFGRGIVSTVDNFGRLGEKPTHPELLDYLATHLVDDGWSLKKAVRFLVTSRTFAMSSEPSAKASESDPANDWLSHMRVRRLEAESIRDSVLVATGELQGEMFGKPADINGGRRSIYLPVRRLSLNSFLQVFDAPKPFTTLGRRDTTNVPAQSLALLNSTFIIDEADKWAGRLIQDGSDCDATRLRRMFMTTFARPPTDDEVAAASSYLALLAQDRKVRADEVLHSRPVWQDFAQSLFNLKEFIYVR